MNRDMGRDVGQGFNCFLLLPLLQSILQLYHILSQKITFRTKNALKEKDRQTRIGCTHSLSKCLNLFFISKHKTLFTKEFFFLLFKD